MKHEMHSPFGPIIMQTTIPDDVFDVLCKISNQSRGKEELDFRRKLAGNIRDEYKLHFDNADEKQDVIDYLIGLAKDYVNEARDQYKVKRFNDIKAKNLQIIDPIWVNFMKQGEWNPAHFHAGHISCVAYLKVPQEISDENTESGSSRRSNQPTAGKIQWTYGESMHFSQTFFTKTPKEKDIFIFPADLKHFVYPFKSEVERVSISCNFIAPNYQVNKLL